MTNHFLLTQNIDETTCLETLTEMVRHKSYSETAGERKLAERMVEIMRNMGLEADLHPVDGGRVNAIGVWRGTGGGKSLLFNGHLDTNPATEGWTVDPWGGLVDDEFIYGIGVSNMKAGDAASLCAVRTLIEAGIRPKGDVILTYVVGELQGGVGTLSAVKQGIKADYFVNSEPTELQAITMHAAAFVFHIELEGITRHLSKREEAVDAIRASCALVPKLTNVTFSDAPSNEHRSINGFTLVQSVAHYRENFTNGAHRKSQILFIFLDQGVMALVRQKRKPWLTSVWCLTSLRPNGKG